LLAPVGCQSQLDVSVLPGHIRTTVG
jgi:hypothetical protein